MKRSVIFLVTLAFGLNAFAQGTILFNNRTPTGDARVTRPDGTGAGAGYLAQLFLVGGGGTVTPIPGVTTFRTAPAAATFFVNPISVQVPGVPAGSPATVRMRFWDSSFGATYDHVVASGGPRGESNDVTISQLGGLPPGGGAPIPDPGLSGLQSFIFPEPSSLSIGLMAAAFLFTRRRR